MELIFLGTGAGVPSPERNVTGIALSMQEERGGFWLFDCGEGTQHQVMRSSLKLSRLQLVFITHLHGDHIYGLPGLLTSRAYQGGNSPLTVFGPPGIKTFIETAVKISGSRIEYELKIVEIDEGIVFRDDQFTVECGKLEHRIDSYGYRIVEHDIPGALRSEKLQAEGVPPGPIYKQIKMSKGPVAFQGRLYDPRDYVGSDIPGRKLAIMGDSRPTRTAVTLAKDVRVLVHEATFAEDKADLAHRYYHATSKQAAAIAREAGADALIMTHFSSRYQGEEVKRLAVEALELHPEVYTAYDGFSFLIDRKEPNT